MTYILPGEGTVVFMLLFTICIVLADIRQHKDRSAEHVHPSSVPTPGNEHAIKYYAFAVIRYEIGLN